MTRPGACLLVLALAALPAASGETLPLVEAEAAFVLREGVPSQDWPPHPGEIVGLALSWPEGARPDTPRLSGAASESDAQGSLVPLRLVPLDPRGGGRDVIEVLPVALGNARLEPLTLFDAEGRPRARLESLELEIAGALAEDDDEAAPARDPVALGLDLLGLALLVSLALLGAGLAVRAWLRRRGKAVEAAPRAATRRLDPREQALEALSALLASGLHRGGDAKAFGVSLAEIGKRFFADTRNVPLLERTSWECARLLRRAGCPEEATEWLVGWLQQLDLVKFAGARPSADELESLALALRARVEGQATEPPGPRTRAELGEVSP